MFIDYVWREYFSNPHEGTGTTYERFILHKYFERLRKRYSVEKLLEAPSFGMTGLSGINSLWWAYNGATVTILDDDEERIHLMKGVWQGLSLQANFVYQPHGFRVLPFKDKSFDLGWNFASIRFVSDLNNFLIELVRVSAKVIFICVPNQGNIWNFMLRLSQGKEKDVPTSSLNPDGIEDIMEELGWHTYERGYFDVPPWPDIAMKKEDMLRRVGLVGMADKLEGGSHNPTCILDYYKGLKPDMEKKFLRYGFLENLPDLMKKFWAHHRYFVFTPRDNE